MQNACERLQCAEPESDTTLAWLQDPAFGLKQGSHLAHPAAHVLLHKLRWCLKPQKDQQAGKEVGLSR